MPSRSAAQENVPAAVPRRFRLAVLNSHPIQYFAPLYRQIAATGDIDLTVYYCSKQGLDRGFVDPGFGREVIWNLPLLEGYRHVFLPNLGGDRGVRGFFTLANPSICGELRRERYDALLVHGHNSVTHLLALAVARLFGTRVFMRAETHLGLRRSAIKRVLRGPLLSLMYRACDACLYIGTRNRDFYRAHRVPSRKLFFVPYAVDNEAFARRAKDAAALGRLRARLSVDPGMPVVLFASKLTARKRPADALLAHAELARRGVASTLLVVGDGALRKSLEEHARRLGSAGVVFAGFVNQDEMPACFALADAFVLPSEDEPWGLVVNEAMACGVPVVTTNAVGAGTDLVQDGVTGYTYPVGDISALADALARIIGRPGLHETMAADCVERMSHWSYSQDIDGIREALMATCDRRRKRL